MSKELTFCVLDYHMSRVSQISSNNRLGARLSNDSDLNFLIVGVAHILYNNPLDTRVSCVLVLTL